MTLIVPTHRARFLAAMRDLVGKPVLWAQKGPDAFDCSGSVTWCLKQVGGQDLRFTFNAQSLADHTRLLLDGEAQLPGDLAFYGTTGPADIEHVAVLKEDGGVISADGATSHLDPRVLGFSTALSMALANPSLRVRLHNTVNYRSDTRYRVVHRNTLVDALDGVTR